MTILRGFGFNGKVHYVESASDAKPCIEINKPIVVYIIFWLRFVMKVIHVTVFRISGKIVSFARENTCDFKVRLVSYDKYNLTYLLLYNRIY